MQTDKLDGMEARYITLEDQLSDPSVIADQNKWRALSKEHAELGEIVSKYREYKESEFDRLAKTVRSHFDMDAFYKILENE